MEVVSKDGLLEVCDGRQQEDEENGADEAADDGECRSGRQQSLAHLHAAEQEDRHDGRHQERRAFVQNGHRRRRRQRRFKNKTLKALSKFSQVTCRKLVAGGAIVSL